LLHAVTAGGVYFAARVVLLLYTNLIVHDVDLTAADPGLGLGNQIPGDAGASQLAFSCISAKDEIRRTGSGKNAWKHKGRLPTVTSEEAT
jgi:hypothetical protein